MKSIKKQIKFFIDQHGCAKNQVDGELIISCMQKAGHCLTFNAEEADLIIVNSCGFIESAKTESLEAVISARKNYPNAKILLAGCLAERYPDDLADSLSEADGIFGNGDIEKITQAAEKIFEGEKPVSVFPQKVVCAGERNVFLSFAGSAFVKITEGCNNKCSFCAIPVIRGDLRSRNAEEIISEIKNLVKSGIYEINLIGQDLAAYGTGADDNVFGTGRTFLPAGTPGSVENSEKKEKSESGLCTLLKMISKIEGNFALRLLYIHPDHLNEDIFPVIKADSRILPYFDIPFQSGSEKIIKSMNRTGTPEKYIKTVRKIREIFPEAALRTTFLTGFPGETEDDFLETLAFLEEIKPDWSGCFPYSREENTKAYSMKGRVSAKTAGARAEKLVSVQKEITKERLSLRTGKIYDILIEEVLKESEESPSEGLAIGRAWFQAPEVDGSVVVQFDGENQTEKSLVKPGRLVKVRITSSGDIDLNGEFIGDSSLNNSPLNTNFVFAQSEI